MKNLTPYFFVLTLFLSVTMVVLSYMSFRRHRENEFYHLTEFWTAMGTNILVLGIFQNMMPQVFALCMVGWVWPLRGLRLVLEDLTKTKLAQRWRYMLLAAGAFLTVALASFGFGFNLYTLPFTLSVVCFALSLLVSATRLTRPQDRNVFHWLFFGAMTIFFFSTFALPYENGFMMLGDLLLYIGLAGITFFIYREITKAHYDEEIDHLIKEKNARLLGQSKYSELGMMSAGIAHEINNPLAVIQARTTQLLRIYRDPNRQSDLADGLQQILYTSERINRTIQGVREFVHQDEQTEASEIELRTLIDDVLAFCGQRMKNHGINLRFYGLDNFSIVGNKIQLEQVILNLLNNSFDAIEYLPDKWIEISAQQMNERIQIFVKDSGSGIPPEIAERIMEPFYSTKDLGKGTGLGLALARGIVEKHGGSLQYMSETSHTTFMVDLPVIPQGEWGISSYH